MRPHSYLTCFALLALTVGGLVSCKEKADSDDSGMNETPQVSEAMSIGTLEGTLGNKPFSIALNEQDSQLTIEQWDGLSNKSKQRDGGEMSLEAFLSGTDLWSGPPRLVTITHHVDELSLTLRFAGRLAVDEKLTALPGCLMETNGTPLVPATKGSWTTAKNVTLPRYDFLLRVTSFDETSGTITGVIKGQLIDPTIPDSAPVPIELTLTSVNEPDPPVEPEAEIPPDEVITETNTPEAIIEVEDSPNSAERVQVELDKPIATEATVAETAATEEDENIASQEPEATRSEETPREEEQVEIRPAVPYKPSRGF